jgi:hypothetical protein
LSDGFVEALRITSARLSFKKLVEKLEALEKAAQTQQEGSKSTAGTSADVLEALKGDKFDLILTISRVWGKEFSDWYLTLKDLDDIFDEIEAEITKGDAKEDGGPDWDRVRILIEGAEKKKDELDKMLPN